MNKLYKILMNITAAALLGLSSPAIARDNNGGSVPPSAAVSDTSGTATVPAAIDTVSGPIDVVRQLHAVLLEVMQNAGELGYGGRYEKLQPVISSLFDTPLISKVILSRYWKDLSDEQQAEFINIFNRLSTATYASRFDGYNGEKFVETGVKELQKGRRLVETELQRKDKEAVAMNYLVHRNNNKWQIISVIADGVNDLSLKRAEYAVVIKDKGYNGLLEDIQSKINDMEPDS